MSRAITTSRLIYTFARACSVIVSIRIRLSSGRRRALRRLRFCSVRRRRSSFHGASLNGSRRDRRGAGQWHEVAVTTAKHCRSTPRGRNGPEKLSGDARGDKRHGDRRQHARPSDGLSAGRNRSDSVLSGRRRYARTRHDTRLRRTRGGRTADGGGGGGRSRPLELCKVITAAADLGACTSACTDARDTGVIMFMSWKGESGFGDYF